MEFLLAARPERTAGFLQWVIDCINAATARQVMIANAGLMDDTPMVDLLGPADAPPAGTVGAAFLTATVPAEAALILVPRERSLGGYTRYKRVR